MFRDFIPVSQVTAQPYVLSVHPSLPVKSVRELVAYAKANPAKLNYASAGQGSLIHLASELFNSTAGIKTVHVPYKGIGVAEAGIKGYAVTQWYGVFVPARTPRAGVERLNREIVKTVHEPGLAGRFAADGAEAVGSSWQEFSAHIKAEHDKWGKVTRETGIKGD